MKAKLKPSICYIAGLSKKDSEKNAVAVETGSEEIELRFVEAAIKEFKIEPTKVVIEEKKDGRRKVYFYHSRIARQLAEIRSREEKLFRVPNEFSCNYLAGMFDSTGGFSKTGVHLNILTPQDEVMLANLGIHTRNGRISNISTFVALIGRYSYLLKSMNMTKRALS